MEMFRQVGRPVSERISFSVWWQPRQRKVRFKQNQAKAELSAMETDNGLQTPKRVSGDMQASEESSTNLTRHRFLVHRLLIILNT